ncbi:hypothetical protein BLNAU_22080 [Blattamonas nauphoetae]|uniref:Uncharacterized protein n=1 Tax=Blattamonas nauphoetae TaxID=2049346 RepID=A0ABQ9WV29_9EUKA|nr:hypothetical protein BLNAU_22080 [Blattamonas nauphoetae]
MSPSNNNRRALTSLFSAPPLPRQSQSILPHHPTAPSHSSLQFQEIAANTEVNPVRVDTILPFPLTVHLHITPTLSAEPWWDFTATFQNPTAQPGQCSPAL